MQPHQTLRETFSQGTSELSPPHACPDRALVDGKRGRGNADAPLACRGVRISTLRLLLNLLRVVALQSRGLSH